MFFFCFFFVFCFFVVFFFVVFFFILFVCFFYLFIIIKIHCYLSIQYNTIQNSLLLSVHIRGNMRHIQAYLQTHITEAEINREFLTEF